MPSKAGFLASAALLGALLFGSSQAQDATPSAPAATPASPESAQAGRSLYGQNCSHCHGFNMVNSGTASYDLRKFPLDDADRFFHSVREGKGSMPAWKGSLNDEQIAKIWAYVQSRGKL